MRSATLCLIAAIHFACGGDDDGGGGGGADARPERDGAPDPADAGHPFTLTTFIGVEQAPLVWVALQDGDAPWKMIASDDGVYDLVLASDRFGIAYVCEVGTPRYLYFFHATVEEFAALTRVCPMNSAAMSGTLSFQVTGLDGDGTAIVAFGNGSALATMADDTIDIDLPVDDWDFVTTVKPSDIVITRVAITPGTITQGETTTIQLGAISGTVAVGNFEATVAGVDPAGANVDARLLTAGGTTTSLNQIEQNYATVPVGSLRDGDLHMVSARAVDDDGTRDVRTFFRDGTDVTLELPAAFIPEVTMAESDPYIRLEATFEPWPGAEVYWLEASQGFETISHRFSWIATSGWLAGAAEAGSWTQPDLSGVSGWDDAWGLDPAEELGWSLHAVKATGDRYALEYFERSGRPWFVAPGDWDGEVVSRAGRSVSSGPQ